MQPTLLPTGRRYCFNTTVPPSHPFKRDLHHNTTAYQCIGDISFSVSLEVKTLVGQTFALSSLPLEDFISAVVTQILVDSQTVTLEVESSNINVWMRVERYG